MRVFIAIELPGEVKQRIAQVQNQMDGSCNKVKWVNSDSVHITVKFLGEIKKRRLTDVFSAVEETAHRFPPFFMEVKGAGAFPHPDKPKVLWMGVEEGASELGQIAEDIEHRLSAHGFSKEKRKWTPHITMGRVKQLTDASALKNIVGEHQHNQAGRARIEQITVMQSRLTPQGAVYTPLRRFYLQGK